MLTYSELTTSLSRLSARKDEILSGKVCLNTKNGVVPFNGAVKHTSPSNVESIYIIPLSGAYILVGPEDTLTILP